MCSAADIVVNYRTGSGCGKAVDRSEEPSSRFESMGFGCLRVFLFSFSFHPFRPILFIYLQKSPLSLLHGIPNVAGSNLDPDCFINRFSAALGRRCGNITLKEAALTAPPKFCPIEVQQ